MPEKAAKKSGLGKADVFTLIFMSLLVIQIALLIHFNLSDIRDSLDADFANTIYHFRQMLAQRSLYLADWYGTTSMELDGSLLFAFPLYLITKNVFTAVGVSNLLIIALYIFTFTKILQNAHVRRPLILFTLCILLTPYSFGMVEYFNMLFFNGACYSIKVLIPLLLILLLQRQEGTAGTAVLTALYLVLLFVTTLSTGIYVMLCGILPVFLCTAIDIWKLGSFRNTRYGIKQLLLYAATALVFAAGFLGHRKLYALASRTDMKLTTLENMAANGKAVLAGLFQLFNALPSDTVEAMSSEGLMFCLRIAVVLMLLSAGVWGLIRIFRTDREAFPTPAYLAMLFFFDLLIVLVSDTRYSGNTDMEYRYLLIGMVPLILLPALALEQKYRVWENFRKNSMYLLLATAVAGLLIGNNLHVCSSWDRSTYAVELCSYFDKLGVDSVFFIDDPDTMDYCRAIDGDLKFGYFNSSEQKLELTICSYEASQNGSFYSGRNVIAVINVYGKKLSDYLPGEITQHYTKTGTAKWFDIYEADQVYFP
ncbi:MAG: hypothetical protein LKJ76_09660 [Lachnospiraceae bacterium]|jgi:hypothetical protein|nr:hypothetical protein [Lachnospiraceae bacterium]